MLRRVHIGLAIIAVAAVAAAVAFSPIVRWRVAVAARRHGIRLRIETVRPARAGFRLIGTSAAVDEIDGVSVAACDVTVHLAWDLHADTMNFAGCVLTAVGSPERVRAQFDGWRLGHRVSTAAHASQVSVRFHDGSLSWKWHDGNESLVAEALEGELDALRGDVRLARAVLSNGPVSLALSRISIGFDASKRFRNVAIDEAVLACSSRDAPNDGTRPAGPSAPSLPGVPPFVGGQASEYEGEVRSAMLTLPPLAALSAASRVAARMATDMWGVGGLLNVGALTLTLSPRHGRVAFTIGPGPASAFVRDSTLDLEFSSNVAATGTPLTVRATLPTAAGDAVVAIEGGPVALSQLGVRDGAGGLVEVANTTVRGRARIVLAGDGSALTFDGDGAAASLSIDDRRIAAGILRGIELQFRARGLLTLPAQLRIDELVASLGSFQLNASGLITDAPSHTIGAFRFEVPTASCQSLLDSLPRGLVPTLQGTAMAGNFGVTGQLGFDARALEDLELRYDVRNDCRITTGPPAVDPDQFRHSFSHRIYLPDGSVGEHITGPGEDTWTPLHEISRYMQVAVLTTEDGAFLTHHGVSAASVRAALIANLKARKFIRGASTITMQLAKNLFLGREKTLSRKLEEVILADLLERKFSKDELMELYLNVIEFGPAVYGIGAASEYYFGRSPAELNLAECMFLSSLLPSPIRYGAMREYGAVPEHWMRFIRTLMESARRHDLITSEEFAEGETESISFWQGGERPPRRPPVRIEPHFDGSSGAPSDARIER